MERKGLVEYRIAKSFLNESNPGTSLRKLTEKRCLQFFMLSVLWHEVWKGGRIRIACDNSAVVINKRSIRGSAILPLQRILLKAGVFNIQILAFWVPSEENTDAASRYDYKKLANLGLQVPRFFPKPAELREAAFLLRSLAPSTRQNYSKITQT